MMDTTNLLQLMLMVILFSSVGSFPYKVVYVYDDVNDSPYMFDENEDFGSYELSNRDTDELYKQKSRDYDLFQVVRRALAAGCGSEIIGCGK